MGHVTSYLLGGFAAVASWTMVAPADSGGPSLGDMFRASPLDQGASVVRTTKTDRLMLKTSPSATPADQHKTVTAIEVVGVNDAAIVYRDRDGNILYRTDPVKNVTVIAKGTKLPEVTVRQDARSSTRPVPVHVPDEAKSGKMPIGCEPAASPIASPELSHLTGRCLAQAEVPVALAFATQ